MTEGHTTPVAGPIDVAYGAATHAGLRRRLNEDAHLARPPLFLVADGMGGHECGDVASSAVVDEFTVLVGRPSLDIDDVRTVLDRARERVRSIDAAARAAGTTLTGVVVADIGGDGYWLAVNVGDSRTYRYANDELVQISVDHSVVQELVDAGALTGEAAVSDRRRNVITRAIGAGSDGEADFQLVPAAVGDRILVCSDGLSGELDADRIREVLAHVADPQDAATRLVHEAMLHGGRDNITAIVVDALAVAGGAEDAYDTMPVPAIAGSAASDEPDVEDTRPRAGARGDS